MVRGLGSAICVMSVLMRGALTQTPVPPWTNTALSPDERADLILKAMTRPDELLLVKGYYGANAKIPWTKLAPSELRSLILGTAGFVPGLDRLGVPALHETDAGVGIANTNQMRPRDRFSFGIIKCGHLESQSRFLGWHRNSYRSARPWI